MDHILFLIKAGFLGFIEGLTEFLPISSTAHLIIFGDWIGFDSGSAKVFEIVIQLGAILAVMWIYRARIAQLVTGCLKGDKVELLFVRNLILAFLPAAVIGLLLIKQINALLDGQFMVYAVTLIVGGIIMLWVETRPGMAKHTIDDSRHNNAQVMRLEDISWKQALVVGFAQCLAMIPGTSRSGSTIIAGMLAGIHRKTATEFSFFLAMPTMIAATALSLFKHASDLNADNMTAIVIGFAMAFVSALFLVKALLAFISKYSYKPFGWYRIVFGIVVFLWVQGIV